MTAEQTHRATGVPEPADMSASPSREGFERFSVELDAAERLAYGGNPAGALKLLDVLQPRLNAGDHGTFASLQASAERLRGDVLEALGRPLEALDAWHALIGLESSLSDELQRTVAISVQPRTQAAKILLVQGSMEEAAALIDEALDKLEVVQSSQSLKTKATINAAVLKLQILKRLGHLDGARDLSLRVGGLLDDPQEELGRTLPAEATQEQLARALVDELNRFKTRTVLLTPEQSGEQAERLYRLCWPYLKANGDRAENAAFLLLEFADSHALDRITSTYPNLSRPPSVNATVPVILRGLGTSSLSDWATELGHPSGRFVEISGLEPANSSSAHALPGSDAVSLEAMLIAEAEMLMYSYQLFEVLLRSPAAQRALKDWNLVLFDAYIPQLRGIVPHLVGAGAEQAAILAGWCLLLARGLYAVAHAPNPDPSLMLDAQSLRCQLKATGTDSWLIDHHASLPTWVTKADD